ncbi:Os10g0515100 [Oryza sativa Japonica Group]|uniref:Os10g0515100 protein n=2 Tax=Oryza sativa subsp. japonica TaxID=39947 RepID=Q0IWE4_ORYSJ|nr:Os10g0515100 [Oryza sativa Japonica Group]BAT11653.1 Os10g0515100 [Oryza sativa Japonica Group]|eukprot:NP_001065057.1 Os10g0515100 [Oryza sativa Japonica Group]
MCPGGCFRRPSSTTAFRYGMSWMSSSETSRWPPPPPPPVLAMISSWSFDWMDGFLTSSAMIHCSAVDVVSVPALRNSEQRLTISSSVSGRLPSSGSLMSRRVSTYECSNVVSFFGSPLAPPCRFLYSRRALISGTNSSVCRRRRACAFWRRPRKRCLVTAGKKAKTGILLDR